MLDIFNNNAFGVMALTDMVNDLEYRPSRIRDIGLFTPTRVSTLSVGIEQVGDILQLVKPSARGGPGETRDTPKRNLRSFQVPHFQRDWGVNADQVQGVREAGSETRLRTVQSVVAQEISQNMADFELTEEHARLGAVTGNVVYADNTNLNLFTEFGVAQAAEVDFDLDNADPDDGVLLTACTGVIRATRAALGGIGFDYVHSFVGDDFFDQLLTHPEVRETYKGHSQATFLRESYVGKNRGNNPISEFGGIVFENYGGVGSSGDQGVGIDADKAKFFPIGVPNLFRTYYAPADYNETVNTLGRRLYARQWARQNGKGIDGELQSNALQLCTRPKALLRGKRT